MRSRRNNTTLTRKVDKWNARKVWLIKRYADGHYAINQEVGGRVFYSHMRSRRNNTTLTRKVDKWNARKVWLIKRYADGHYAINQEVGGRVFYSRFQRATKAQIAAIFACC